MGDGKMKIALLGDLGLFGKYTVENEKIRDYFKNVSQFLHTMDIVVGNLEVPFCNVDKPFGSKSAYLKSDPKNVELLKYLNISIVSLANNHIFDYGKDGYLQTKKVLKDANINYFGIENKQYFFKELNNRVAFSGYCCYSTNSLGYLENKAIGVNELNYEKVENNLKLNVEDGFLNIISFHIGEEHINYPNYDHIELARKLSDQNAYIFYGHHPHVLQGIEKYKNSLHAFSLGNFCFDDVYTKKSNEPLIKQKLANKESCIVILDIQDNKLNNYEIVPIFDNGVEIKIGNNLEINRKINNYSSYLQIEKSVYIKSRNILRNNFISERKKKRDFKWYLERLNYKSFFILKDLKQNKLKYSKNLGNYLGEK